MKTSRPSQPRPDLDALVRCDCQQKVRVDAVLTWQRANDAAGPGALNWLFVGGAAVTLGVGRVGWEGGPTMGPQQGFP